MSIYIYARRKQDAETWAREQGIRPKDRCYTFGAQSRWREGFGYRTDDRIVILGELDHHWETTIQRSLAKAAQRPPVERLALATPAPPA